MRRREALAYLAHLRRNPWIERLRPVTLQQLAQIAVDARIQIGVRSAGGAQWHVGPEIATLPEMLAAVIDRMLLRQVVTPWPDGAREIQRERVVVNLHTLP